MIVFAVGLEREGVSVRSIMIKLRNPALILYAIVLIPALLGILGLKPDRIAWAGFSIIYLLTMIGLQLLKWKMEIDETAGYNRALFTHFLVALPLGLLAYLIAHVIVNRGVATVEHGESYIVERLWLPNLSDIRRSIKTFFDLPRWARVETEEKSPVQALRFAVFVFVWYGLQAVFDVGASDFITVVHAVGITMACGLMLEGFLPRALMRRFSLYWMVSVFFCLPFGGTLVFTHTPASIGSVLLFVVGFVVLAFLLRRRTFVSMSVLGLVLGSTVSRLAGAMQPLTLIHGMGYLAVGVVLLCAIVFGKRSETFTKDKVSITKAIAASLSHETRGSLNKVKGNMYLHLFIIERLKSMQNEKGEKGFWLPDDIKKDLEQKGDTITKTIERVEMEFDHFDTSIKKGINAMNQKQASIRDLIEKAVVLLHDTHRSMDIQVKCVEDFTPTVITDLFQNVIHNLIKNAYVHARASKVKILINGKDLTVQVSNNGKPIPSDILPYIFNLHFTTKPSQGSGIGLALLKIILEASHVGLTCLSQPTSNKEDFCTTFAMKFPEEKESNK